jgi:hypothetical protein
MKRWVQRTSLGVMVLSLLLLTLALGGKLEAGGGAGQIPIEPAGAGRSGLMQVDLGADESMLSQLSPREREDQYRDWLLYSAVASLNPTAQALSKSFFDLPAVRHGYMRAVGAFEYGVTRSSAISADDVVALVPAGVGEAQRRDHLSTIADQQRKNRGGAFKRLQVFEYTLDAESGQASLQRVADADFSALFSLAFGYVERTITDLEGLREYMLAVDDLTLVRKAAQGLVVGGRKLAQPMRTLGVEHVATLWQAQQHIQAAQAEWEAYAEPLEAQFQARWEGRRYRTEAEHSRLKAEHEQEFEALKAQLQAEHRRRHLVKSIGFSLDPVIDFVGLQRAFAQGWPLWESRFGNYAPSVSSLEVSMALADEDIRPYLRLMNEVQPKHPELAGALHQLKKGNSYQAARYDGPLQGTEVGMVLFYTDLIAKLWTIDYLTSAPPKEAIRGFVTDPMVMISLAYQPETEALNEARLWFGPATAGYALGDASQSMYFSRVATRIFSAGHASGNPQAETQTSAFLAASIDWWNDHYEEVAVFEPEYQRLNAIMKWSAVIAWLSGSNDAGRLDYLEPVKVSREAVFDQWVTQHPELKFKHWRHIAFHPAGHMGTTTEAMPMLSGEVTSGGVSLADRTIAKQAAVAMNVDRALLRSHLDYGVAANAKTLTTLDKSVFAFAEEGANVVAVTARARDGLKLRATNAQLTPTDVRSTFVLDGENALKLRVDAAGEALGELRVTPSPNGFSVGWLSRDLDRAHSLGHRLSISRSPEKVLQRDPLVETFVRMEGEGAYLVKLTGSPKWIRYEAEKAPRLDIDPEWHMRVAGASPNDILQMLFRSDIGRRVMQLRVLDEAAVKQLLAKGHVAASTDDAGRVVLRWSEDSLAADARTLALDTSQGSTKVWVDGSGDLHLHGVDALSAARALRNADLEALRAAVAKGDVRKWGEALGEGDTPLIAALERQDYRTVARHIAADPVAMHRRLARQLTEALKINDAIRAERGLAEALHDLDRLVALHGAQPEVLLRRGLLQIERGNVRDAVSVAAQVAPKRPIDRVALIAEVSARLRGGVKDGESLVRYTQYLTARERTLAQPNAFGDFTPQVRETAGKVGFDFDYTLRRVPTEPVSSKAIPPDAVVYYQPGASLNQVDWRPSMDRTLTGLIDGQLARVVQLPEGSVATYRPSKIWLPDQKIELQLARRTSLAQVTRMPAAGYGNCTLDPETGVCQGSGARDDEARTGAGGAKPAPVYLVLASQ